ncbi:MAG: DUF1566 domain-containing protein [Treponema sp.]|jgi:TolB-like protein|nr:DUF1566 domain-containing protein [Treponema sp.]
MNRNLFFNGVITVLLVITLAGCASGAQSVEAASAMEPVETAEGIKLDAALLEAAENIDARIKGGTKVAILNFGSPSNQFSEYAIDELSANLVNSQKLVIVDRREIDLIRSEVDFQYSGEVSDASMQSIGRMLGAQSIISGRLSRIGDVYRIVIRVLNVESAAVQAQYRTDIVNDSRVKALLADENTEQRDTQSGKIYELGAIGPSGGRVFYDKGMFSNGWQYLEAAPAEMDATAQWSANQKNLAGTGTAVGSGKRNTQLIVERLKQLGETNRAAQLCDDLSFDGFDDWFLPSKDELNLMYINLKQKGLGDFSDGSYWSSTQDDNDDAWVQRFNNGWVKILSNGKQDGDGKRSTYYVRAVRAF